MTDITRRDIERNLESRFVERGLEYANEGRVTDLRRGENFNSFTALVEGSAAEPYQVSVQLVKGRAGVNVYGQCTCPMHINCKHVAAVLFATLNGAKPEPLRTRSSEIEVVAPEVPALASQRPAVDMPHTLQLWMDQARQSGIAMASQDVKSRPNAQCLLYVLRVHLRPYGKRVTVNTVLARTLKSGGYSSSTAWSNAQNAVQQPPSFVSPVDVRALRQLLLDASRGINGEFELHGTNGPEVLARIIATQRCHWISEKNAPLRLGELRPGEVRWEFDDFGVQHLRLVTQPENQAFLPLAPPWYVDLKSAECGPISLDLTSEQAEVLARIPEIPPTQVESVQSLLTKLADGRSLILPSIPVREDVSVKKFTPCLRLGSLMSIGYGIGRYRPLGEFLEIATLAFDYDGIAVTRDSPGLITSFRDGKLMQMRRDQKAEKLARTQLDKLGFIEVRKAVRYFPNEHKHDYTLPTPDHWLGFVTDALPALEAQGWQVEIDEHFRFRIARVSDWSASIEPSGHDWFDLRIEAEVDGKRSNLLPIVLAALRDEPELADTLKDETLQGDRRIVLTLDDGRLFPAPVARLRAILSILNELFDGSVVGSARLSRLDAARLAHLEEATDLKWQGGEELRALGKRLARFEGIVPTPPPEQFGTELRHYQAEGLSWLQFLRDYGINGILADDMGLGKTIQALAHILLEKQAGRLDRPALVVSPTSVLPNWRAEAQRFAPQLRVHVSHGLARKAAFDQFSNADVVLTTYPLLSRDKEALLKQPFHLVVLDEAQQIKNAQTQAAKIVGEIDTRHRLCLSGTPLENHLGELWSLFHFLMPGFLGDDKAFRKAYRTPIEKHGNELRRHSLARRIRPFILRRTKEQVAAELPPKSEMLRTVEFDAAQKDLYETVRLSMHERVRAEIQARGLAQSHIIVLDALLKLRQICCDPRLLKLEAAKKVKASAKLQLLMEMLPELLDEGRRVLLFSQFTSMLALIEERLKEQGIKYAKLTGDTKNRELPVKAFQKGEVRLFLISLKAGGTGLNLTAADTVIHYDPWWNPAVENQATDRAHRIGQDKPVFVYKLIVAGSVEEKITAMQKNKAALAASLLDGAQKGGAALSAEDISALFEPMS